MNQAPGQQQKKGLSPTAIVLIVIGVLVVGGLATCGVGAYMAGQKLKEVRQSIGDGGLVMVSPEAVTTALAGEKKDYVGTWTSKSGHSTLSIAPTGQLVSAKNETASKTTLNGPIAAFEGNDIVLKVGIEFRFKVSQPPHQVDGKWQMVADGVTYLRD